VILKQHILKIKTPGRSMINITSQLSALISAEKIESGLCHLFIHHTSASLIICENADPTVQSDMEAFMQRLVPDGDKLFQHTMEGPDDMPAHVRSILTQTSLTIPITQHQLALGTWQGVYLWEHRLMANERKITVTIQS
jgi:secondary thiamine-phosphate synthase enzyme